MARRSFLRACGGSAALLLPLLRDIEARANGAPAPAAFPGDPEAARRPVAAVAAGGAHGDDDGLHAARLQRAVRAAAVEDGDDRRPQHRLPRGPAGGDGGAMIVRRRHGRADDRPAGAGEIRPARLVRGRRVDRSDLARPIARAGRAASADEERRSDRCSSPPTSAPTATRSRRACCRTSIRCPNEPDITRARQPLYPEIAAARGFQPAVRRARCRPGPRPATPPACSRRS